VAEGTTAPLRLAGRNDDRAADMLVPHSISIRHGAPRAIWRSSTNPRPFERTRGSQGLDQQAHGRRQIDYVTKSRGSELFTEALAKHGLEAADGGGLQGGAGRIHVQSGPDSGSGVARKFRHNPPQTIVRPRFWQELMENLVWRARFR